MQYQGHEDHAEGKKDDQVALGKRAAIGKSLRQGDSSGERDDSAHSGPAYDQHAFYRWHGHLLVKDAAANPVCQPGAGEYPYHPQCDYQRAEQCSVQKQSAMPVAVNPGQHIRKLQSDQNKDYAVEDEVESFPNCPGLQPHTG